MGQKVGGHANLRYVLFEGNKKTEGVPLPEIKRAKPKNRNKLMRFLNRTDDQIKEDKLQNIFHGRQLELQDTNPSDILTGTGGSEMQPEENKMM